MQTCGRGVYKSTNFPQITNSADLEDDQHYFIWSKEIYPELEIEPDTYLERGHTFTKYHSLIQFQRSRTIENTILEGTIGLATTDQLGEYYNEATAKQIEALYKKLSRWIKKNYDNNLLICSESKKFTSKPVRHTYLGSQTKQWLVSNKKNRLKQLSVGSDYYYSPSELIKSTTG